MWKRPTFEGLELGSAQASNETFDFLKLCQEWEAVVGPTLGQLSVPFKLKQGTLFLLTKHPVVSEQLSFLHLTILTKIRQLHPRLSKQVKKMAFEYNEQHFIVGQSKIAEQKAALPQKLHPYSPEYRRLRQEAEQLFNVAEDPAERECWISLYIQCAQEKTFFQAPD